MPPWRIGVDVGGTFTDLVAIDGAGVVFAHKSPTTPADPAQGVLNAIEDAAARLAMTAADFLGSCEHLIHGSTIATNILLEDTGAKVGLIVTEGFRDTLEVRRGYRPDPWDHRKSWCDVIVPRHRRVSVSERVDKNGEIVRPLEPDSVRRALATFQEQDVQAVAVCMINSYLNPTNEQACREIIQNGKPDIYVTCSAELAPVQGEYERSSTVAVNAYLAPKVVPYLEGLEKELKARGLKQKLLLVQSNGGVLSFDQVRQKPCSLALSGPAAGVGALRMTSDTGSLGDLIAIEVGGTSCDVTLIKDGRVAELESLTLDERHIALPSVEIHTIGAGGGTIAGVDGVGMLFAGPRGAGANPGLACYGLGGENPTVTDAQMVLGHLKPGPYANNSITLDDRLAKQAIRDKVANPIGVTTESASTGIIRLVEQNMRHAVEKLSFERGLDPREFMLVGAGGAGALHVAAVARSLGCRRAFVPKLAGVFCAFGMCNSDVRHDFVRSFNARTGGIKPSDVNDAFAALERDGAKTLADEGFDPHQMQFDRVTEIRYAGQGSALRIPIDGDLETWEGVRSSFEQQYDLLFGHIQPGGEIEIANIHVAAIGNLNPLKIEPQPLAKTEPHYAAIRDIYVDERHGKVSAKIFFGDQLGSGHVITGPAIIEENTTTVLIGPNDRARVDAFGNYLLEIGGV
jgi:N-methylhydantoinase A